MNLKSITLYSVSILILFAIFMAGYISASFVYKKELSKIMSEVELIFPPLPENIRSISGKIKEMGDDYIMLETMTQNRFPWEDRVKYTVKVNLSDDVEIMENDLSQPPSIGDDGLPSMNIKVVELNSLNIDDVIIVSSDVDVKNLKEFNAKRITKNKF